MGASSSPTALLAVALLIFWTYWKLLGPLQFTSGRPERRADKHLESLKRPWQQQRRNQLSQTYIDTSLDDGRQRDALLALYDATQGPTWRVANLTVNGAVPWGTEGVSYCRWYGVTCCATSPLSLVDCDGEHSVAILSLDGFGLEGSLPESLGDLRELTVLALGSNPLLAGGLPQSMSHLPHLLWMSVEDTGLVACVEASNGLQGGGSGSLPPPLSGPCTLPVSLVYSDPYKPYSANDFTCPVAILRSFLSYTSAVSPYLRNIITSPFPPPPTPGAVIAGANFTRFFNCSCRDASGLMLKVYDSGSNGGAQCVNPSGSTDGHDRGLVIGIVIACVMPWLLVASCIYICVAHKATLHRLVQRKEAEMARKRSKVPGTPGVALQNGRGLLSLSDVMVTWVVTDVASSTQLWEWKPDVMDRAIDLHNIVLRSLIDEFGGHEIRNEGDSFTLSFHDAVDAVMFCLKAQEKLMAQAWPKELVEHPRTSTVSVGDVTSNPDAASKGPPLIAGLRVRMGINTGVPDDIFLHDLTDHVDYRGLEYDLAGEICDLAEGGQVLMGPRTLQRWNKVNYSTLIDPDILRDQQAGSFVQPGVGGQPPTLLHGPSGRRGSMTGLGGLGGGGLGGGLGGLGRESQQQVQSYLGSTFGGMGPGSAATGGGAGPGAGGGNGGYAMSSTMTSLRRNSDSQQQPHSGGAQALAQLSGDEEGPDDENSSAAQAAGRALAAGALAALPAARSMRTNRSSSPLGGLRMASIAQLGVTHSSNRTVESAAATATATGTAATIAGGVVAAAPSVGSGRSAGTMGGLLASNFRNRGNLGSPRAAQASSMSYNDGAAPLRYMLLATPPATGPGSASGVGKDADGRPSARPVRRVSSTEGLLYQHAACASEVATAAAAAAAAAAVTAAAATVAAARSAATGHYSHSGRGPLEPYSDDDRGSPPKLQHFPYRDASVPLPLPLRLSNARASANSTGDGHARGGGGGQGHRREDSDCVGTWGASAPLPVVAGLQRLLSHGWRGLQITVLPPRVQIGLGPGGEPSVCGSPSHAAAQLHTPGGSGVPNNSSGAGLLGWGIRSRLNGALYGLGATLGLAPAPVASAQQQLRGPGVIVARVSNGAHAEDAPSLPVVSLEDDDKAAATAGADGGGGGGGGGSANRIGLSRIYSLPTAAVSYAAISARAAAAQRRTATSETPSREGSLKHQGQSASPGPGVNSSLFTLRKLSRDGSRDGVSTPTRADSPVMHPKPQQPQQLSTMAQVSSLGISAGSGEIDCTTASAPAGEGGGSGGRWFGHSGSGYTATPPVVASPSGRHSGSFDASKLSGLSRRALAGMPGPPRMSLALEAGLHPLLMNPMQPGSLTSLPGSRMPLTLRHPQQLVQRQATPSPLGMGSAAENGIGPSSAILVDPVIRTGDSISSAGKFMRGITLGSVYRPMPETQRGSSLDGGGPATSGAGGGGSGSIAGGVAGRGPPGGQRGDSGALLKAASIVHQLNEPTANMSYQQNAPGGYFLAEVFPKELDSGGAGGGMAPMHPLLHCMPKQCWPLLPRLEFIWFQLVRAFRNLLHHCLICVRLLTSSDDDPVDVNMWDHTDGMVLGGVPGVHRAATAGSKPQETKGVLVDMGYYQFTTLEYSAGVTSPTAGVLNYVHLMQIAPSSVAARVLMFPWPLALPDGWEKISPGFFDAPGSGRLIFPDMRELIGGDLQAVRPVVTVAFSSIEGFKELSAVSVDAGRDVLQLHNAAVRETLSTCSGYECKEFNGSFMTTFASPTSAVEWALTLQLALVAMPWPEDLRNCEATAVVLNPEKEVVLFRGLRCRVGIYAGPIDRVTPHAKTGRADYFGQPVNRAARLMTAALGGQVVLDQNLLDEVIEEWRRRQEVRRLATIPSVEEGSLADEGSVRGSSEMRLARSFVSAKSTNRLRHMGSTAASSTPSVAIQPEISMQHLNAQAGAGSIGTSGGDTCGVSAGGGGEAGTSVPTTTGSGPVAPSAIGTNSVTGAAICGSGWSPGAASDAPPPSPFSSPESRFISRMRTSSALKVVSADNSISPQTSAKWPLRGSTNYATGPAAAPSGAVGGSVSIAAPAIVGIDLNSGGAGRSGGGGSHTISNPRSLVRSLERLLINPKVQRSARSEPRIQRVSRLGLSGLTAVLKVGAGGSGGTSGASTCGVGNSAATGTAIHTGANGVGGVTPTTFSPSTAVGTAGGFVPWLSESASLPMPGHRAHSSSFLQRPGVSAAPGGSNGGSSGGAPWRMVGSPRSSVAIKALGATSLSGGQPTASGSGAARGGSSAPGVQMPLWMTSALLTRTSPGPSRQGSMAGSVSAWGNSDLSTSGLAAAGLEVQPAEWDPVSRQAVATRARRRRRASVGEIVGSMLQLANRGSTAVSAYSRHGALIDGGSRHGGSNMLETSLAYTSRGGGATGIQTPGWHTPGRSPSSCISPAAATMRARLLPGSPQSTASSGSCGGAVAPAMNLGSNAVLSSDVPESPSVTLAVASPRSAASGKLLAVRRTGSSPLGLVAVHARSTLEMTGAAVQPPGSDSLKSVIRRQSLGEASGLAQDWFAAASSSAATPPVMPISSRHPQHRHFTFQQRLASVNPLEARHQRNLTTTASAITHHRRHYHHSQQQLQQQMLNKSNELLQPGSGMPTLAENTECRPPTGVEVVPLPKSSWEISPPQSHLHASALTQDYQTAQRQTQTPPFTPHQLPQLEVPAQRRLDKPRALSFSLSFVQRSLPTNAALDSPDVGLMASVAEAPTPSLGLMLETDLGTARYANTTQVARIQGAGEASEGVGSAPSQPLACRLDWDSLLLKSRTNGGNQFPREGAVAMSGHAAPWSVQRDSLADSTDVASGQLAGSTSAGISEQLFCSHGGLGNAVHQDIEAASGGALCRTEAAASIDPLGQGDDSGISDGRYGKENENICHAAAAITAPMPGPTIVETVGDAKMGNMSVADTEGNRLTPVLVPPLRQPSQFHEGSVENTSPRTSRTATSSFPTFPTFAVVPVLSRLQPSSERTSPHPRSLIYPPPSPSFSTASSSLVRRMYHRSSSTGASGALEDLELIPSFATNLQRTVADSLFGGTPRATTTPVPIDGNVSANGFRRADSDLGGLQPLLRERNICDRSYDGVPMPGRRFITVHGNPVYLPHRSMTGEMAIAEGEEEGKDDVSSRDVGAIVAEERISVQSLELLRTNTHSCIGQERPPRALGTGATACASQLSAALKQIQQPSREPSISPAVCSRGSGPSMGGDVCGGLILGMPPLQALQALQPPSHHLTNEGVATRTGVARRFPDSPQHWSMVASSAAAGSSQPLPGNAASAPNVRTVGRRRMSRNNSGITMQPMTVASCESFVSDAYCLGRSVANGEDTAQVASSQHSGSVPLRYSTPVSTSQKVKTSHGAIQSVAVDAALRMHPSSADITALGGVAPGSYDGLIPGESSGGGNGVRTGRQSGGVALAAATIMVPLLAPGSTATIGRRRASSGAIGVSLRAAAELAISQMRPGSSFNSHSGSQHSTIAVGATGNSSGSRGLRKSTSSRGRRNVGESRASISSWSPLNDAAYGAAGGTGIRTQGVMPQHMSRLVSDAPATEHFSALVSAQSGLDVRGLPTIDRGAGLARIVATRATLTSSQIPPISSLTRPDGGLSVCGARGNAAQRRSAPAQRLPGSGSGRVGAAGGPHAIGAPTRPTAASATVSALHTAPELVAGLAQGTLQAIHGNPAVNVSGPGTGGDASVGTGSTSIMGTSTGSHAPYGGSSPGHVSLLHPLPQSQHQPIQQMLHHHHHHQQQQQQQQRPLSQCQQLPPYHPTIAAMSSGYSQLGTAESLATPYTGLQASSVASVSSLSPRGNGARTSCPDVAGNSGGSNITASMVLMPGTAPSTSHCSLMGNLRGDDGGGSSSIRAGMRRASTPQIPFLPSLDASGASIIGAAGNGGGASGVVPFLPMSRLRASNQSCPEDVISAVGCAPGPNVAMSTSRELGRPSESAPTQLKNRWGLSMETGRSSRRRSPRTQISLFPSEEGTHVACSISGGGSGGGIGSGSGPSLDKAPHAPGSPEAVPAASSGTCGGGGVGGGGGGGVGGANISAKVDKESRPAVMAECYKITQQPTGGVGAGYNEVAQSITMIKYTNLKQELTRDDAEEPDDVLVPTNMLMVPTVPVEVAIWSLGVFRLKGVIEPIKIVQVLPVELEGRLAILNKAGLNRGKARCIERRVACLDVITLQLPDVSQLSCVAMASAEAAAAGMRETHLPGRLESIGDEGPGDDGLDRLGRRAPEDLETKGHRSAGGVGIRSSDSLSAQVATPQLPSFATYIQHGSESSAGAAVAPSGAVGRGDAVAPFSLRQATSPADTEENWAGSQMRSGPLRGLEYSDAGLPPINEVTTPASSPIVGSRERRQACGHSSAAARPMPTDTRLRPGAVSLTTTLSNGDLDLGMNLDKSVSSQPLSTGAPGGNRSAAQLQDLAAEFPATTIAGSSLGYRFRGSSTYTSGAQALRNFTHPNYSHQHPADMVEPYGSGGVPGSTTSASSALDGRASGASQASDRQSPAAARAAGEGISTAPLSTGLLPCSLSFMAHRGTRDTMSTFAALVSAGIVDVRSPGGSPVNAPLLPNRDSSQLQHEAAAAAPAEQITDPDPGAVVAMNRGPLQLSLLPLPKSGVETAHRHGFAGASALASALSTSPLSMHDRASADTHTPTNSHTRSALVIDRSSSGFNHAFSGCQTPGRAFTERSSSGRYGSARVPPGLLGTDRSSSGLSQNNDVWSLGGSGGGGYNLALAQEALSLRGRAPARMPQRMSASGQVPSDGGPAPSRYVHGVLHQQQQQQQSQEGGGLGVPICTA